MANVFDHRIAESGATAWGDFETPPLGSSRTEREGHRREIVPEVCSVAVAVGCGRIAQTPEPTDRERDVGDFFVVHDLADLRALGIARFREGVAVGQGEIEIGLFEGEAHRCQESARTRWRGRNGRDLLPEVVGMVVCLEVTAMRFESRQVESAMALFVHEGGEQSAAQ